VFSLTPPPQALRSAEAEESSLAEALAQEQDKAIQTAMAEEETWLQELAKEQGTDIDIETETESELGVGCSLVNRSG